MVVEVRNRQRRRAVDAARLASYVERVLEGLGVPGNAEAGIVLVSDRLMSVYNRSTMGRRGTTDVLAFPIDTVIDPADPAPYLGDVVVSVERAEVEGRRRGHGLRREFATYLIHGLLHLLGYDDSTPEQRRRMGSATNRLVRRHARRPMGVGK